MILFGIKMLPRRFMSSRLMCSCVQSPSDGLLGRDCFMRAVVLLWIKSTDHLWGRDGSSWQGAVRGSGLLECVLEGVIFGYHNISNSDTHTPSAPSSLLTTGLDQWDWLSVYWKPWTMLKQVFSLLSSHLEEHLSSTINIYRFCLSLVSIGITL